MSVSFARCVLKWSRRGTAEALVAEAVVAVTVKTKPMSGSIAQVTFTIK